MLIFVIQKKTNTENARELSFPSPNMYVSFHFGMGVFSGKMPKNGRRDKEFIMLAVALNGLCLQYASVELRSDRQVVLQAIRSNPYAFLGFKPKKIWF